MQELIPKRDRFPRQCVLVALLLLLCLFFVGRAVVNKANYRK